jgi:hypothetical protein
VVVPAAPVVPGDEDGGVLPVGLPVGVFAGAVADGIDLVGHVGRSFTPRCLEMEGSDIAYSGMTQLICCSWQFWISLSIGNDFPGVMGRSFFLSRPNHIGEVGPRAYAVHDLPT